MVLCRLGVCSAGLVEVCAHGGDAWLIVEDAKESKYFTRNRNILPFSAWFVPNLLAVSRVDCILPTPSL